MTCLWQEQIKPAEYLSRKYLILIEHYSDVIMSAMAPQITSLTIVYSTVNSGTDQRTHQASAPLAFVRGIHRGQVNSPHRGPVTRKIFPFDDVIMDDVDNVSVWCCDYIIKLILASSGKETHKPAGTRNLTIKFCPVRQFRETNAKYLNFIFQHKLWIRSCVEFLGFSIGDISISLAYTLYHITHNHKRCVWPQLSCVILIGQAATLSVKKKENLENKGTEVDAP